MFVSSVQVRAEFGGMEQRKKQTRWITEQMSREKGKKVVWIKERERGRERESYFSLMAKERDFIRKTLTDVLIRSSS